MQFSFFKQLLRKPSPFPLPAHKFLFNCFTFCSHLDINANTLLSSLLLSLLKIKKEKKRERERKKALLLLSSLLSLLSLTRINFHASTAPAEDHFQVRSLFVPSLLSRKKKKKNFRSLSDLHFS